MHIMGGLAGFMGTYLIGPRAGLFSQDNYLTFILEDNFEDEAQVMERSDKRNETLKSRSLS